MLALLDQLSLPGDPAKANEDAFAHGALSAVVLDGATPLGDSLMPGPSDAAWIARFGARRLLAHLEDGDGARKALRAALGETQKSFTALRRAPPQDMWQTPSASMMLVVETCTGLPSLRARSAQEGEVAVAGPRPSESRRGPEIEFLWFGDCTALVRQGDGPVTVIGETFDKRAAEATRARAIGKAHGLSPALDFSRPEFLEKLRAGRNRINSGNSWLFTPDARAASHVSRRVMKLASGTVILLASDGLLALASDYGAYSADSLMVAARDRGLAALGEELRAIEAADAGGDKFPRFKTSDDATALLLQLA